MLFRSKLCLAHTDTLVCLCYNYRKLRYCPCMFYFAYAVSLWILMKWFLCRTVSV